MAMPVPRTYDTIAGPRLIAEVWFEIGLAM